MDERLCTSKRDFYRSCIKKYNNFARLIVFINLSIEILYYYIDLEFNHTNFIYRNTLTLYSIT
jgi:hypothetical protein